MQRPNQQPDVYHSLPELPSIWQPKPHHRLPRRYEEMSTWKLQSLTHDKIMYLGEKVHERELAALERGRKRSLKDFETELWKEAEDKKQRAIQDTLDKVQTVHRREIRRITEETGKKLEKELQRHKNSTTLESQEAVLRVRRQLDEEKRQAIETLEKRCHVELQDAVAKLERETHQDRSEVVDQVKIEYERKIEEIKAQQEQKVKTAVEQVQKKLLKEKEEAVEAVRNEERRKGQEAFLKEQALHKANVKALSSLVVKRDAEVEQLQQQMRAEKVNQQKILDELHDMRESFQQFVDSIRPFQKGYSDYLVPPIKSQVYK